MRRVTMVSLVMVITFGLVGYVLAQEEPGKPNLQTTCPVMGGKIDKNVYVEYEGKRIYFCCEMCIDKFEEDPEKYLEEMEDQGITLERAPTGARSSSRERGSSRGCGSLVHEIDLT